MSSISIRLKFLIEQLGIKQIDVANLTNVSQQAISYILTNHVEKSFYTYQIAIGLGVNPEWLANGVGEIFSEKTLSIPCYNSILDLKFDIPSIKKKTRVKKISRVVYAFSVYLDNRNALICGVAPENDLQKKEYLCIQGDEYFLLEDVGNKKEYDLCFLILEKRQTHLKLKKTMEVVI
ncbi:MULTISPECIES: helix-turn-helix domain-containing protein [unclassified Providencia]|uniref:helix-turn-helix domain-containing protein n=1 Tax=unclassified Providencia TaxID=2633465 RepID=UPI00234AB215|nr:MULTISPECIES: helix-turn-helix transcriptional regulator [unclassified Providencia]